MTILLAKRVFMQFPADLSPHLFSFLGFRTDWRTCKKNEADLISAFSAWTRRVLDDDALDWYYPGAKVEFPIMFSQAELNVYLEWTLFGRWYLILLTRDNFYWHQTREIMDEPAFHMEDYKNWYEWEFLWHHNQKRYFK
jgi:hypothetical protein